jgi:hypothetical protein
MSNKQSEPSPRTFDRHRYTKNLQIREIIDRLEVATDIVKTPFVGDTSAFGKEQKGKDTSETK